MGMRKQLAKGASYAAAPKATFAAFNPGKAAAGKATSWAMDRMMPERRRRSRRNSTMKGLGAAAMAIPIGIWLGRRFWSSNEATRTHADMS
jgi:hypothetical protein